MGLNRKNFTPEQQKEIALAVREAMEVARRNGLKEALLWLEQVAREVHHYKQPGRRWALSALTALQVHLKARMADSMPYEPFE